MSSPLVSFCFCRAALYSFSLGALLALLGALPARAQTQHRAVPEVELDTAFEPKVKPEAFITRVAEDFTIDGKVEEAAWQEATYITGFTEFQPGDQVEPQVRTEAFVAHDEAYLYLAFIAHDDPKAVRASLRNRDEIFQDDWVGVVLDPYGDAAQAYEIFANPLGVQGDLLMSKTNEDPGFDLVYRSEGRLTEDGYEVEIAIPFSSLRFPDRPVQEWRITFLRNHPRGDRHLYSWATVDRDDPCLMCQLGTLRGIEGVEPSTNLDLLPGVVGSQAGALADPDDPSAGFDNGRVQVEPAFNARYNFTPSLAAEATINPDFSQVESDAAQIDVNSTFALSFPERRPFFQEGSDLFDSWIDIVYTRSINDPITAAKLTGRSGRWSLAYLAALDEHTPLLLPFEERSDIVRAGRSAANILRARRTFGENSFVGATFTDRRLLDGGSGTLGSADLQLQFLRNYQLQAQLALSDTREPVSEALSEQISTDAFARGKYTAALDGEQYLGYGNYLSLERNARHWNFDVDYRAYSPTFRTPSGFVTGNDFHRLSMSQRVVFHPEAKLVNYVRPGAYVQHDYNFGGERKENLAEAQLFVRGIGQTQVYLEYGLGRERFRGQDFEGLRSWVAEVNSFFSEPFQLGFFVAGGRSIRRTDEPELGNRLNAGARMTIKPLQRLVIDPSIEYASMHDLETGEQFFRGYVLRARTSFQFTRELSLRLVTQYDSFSERFSVEPLLSYKLNPFSVFYVGSTHDYHAFDAPHGVTPTDRQLFFKFQYLFRI